MTWNLSTQAKHHNWQSSNYLTSVFERVLESKVHGGVSLLPCHLQPHSQKWMNWEGAYTCSLPLVSLRVAGSHYMSGVCPLRQSLFKVCTGLKWLWVKLAVLVCLLDIYTLSILCDGKTIMHKSTSSHSHRCQSCRPGGQNQPARGQDLWNEF